MHKARHCAVVFAACVCSKFFKMTRGGTTPVGLTCRMVGSRLWMVSRYGVCLFRCCWEEVLYPLDLGDVCLDEASGT